VEILITRTELQRSFLSAFAGAGNCALLHSKLNNQHINEFAADREQASERLATNKSSLSLCSASSEKSNTITFRAAPIKAINQNAILISRVFISASGGRRATHLWGRRRRLITRHKQSFSSEYSFMQHAEAEEKGPPWG